MGTECVSPRLQRVRPEGLEDRCWNVGVIHRHIETPDLHAWELRGRGHTAREDATYGPRCSDYGTSFSRSCCGQSCHDHPGHLCVGGGGGQCGIFFAECLTWVVQSVQVQGSPRGCGSCPGAYTGDRFQGPDRRPTALSGLWHSTWDNGCCTLHANKVRSHCPSTPAAQVVSLRTKKKNHFVMSCARGGGGLLMEGVCSKLRYGGSGVWAVGERVDLDLK